MRARHRRARLSLLSRVVLANAAVLTVVTLLLLFSPIEINAPVTQNQAIILVVGFVVSLTVSVLLLHRAVTPVRRLAETMRSVDPLEPGRRLPVSGANTDVDALTTAFNELALAARARCGHWPRRSGSASASRASSTTRSARS